MTTSATRAVAACALLVGTSLLALSAAPAAAQDAPLPPTVRTQSPLGVDLNRGAFVTSSEDISIGTGSFPQRLSVQRVYDSGLADYTLALGNGTTHSLDIKAVETIANGESIVSINLGLSAVQFRFDYKNSSNPSQDALSAKNKDGSKLERLCVNGNQCTRLQLTTRDGAVLVFGIKIQSGNQAVYRISSWTAPDGNVARFQYLSDLTANGYDDQLLSVYNSSGLALFFSYGDGAERLAPYGYSTHVKRITSFNFKEQYCDRYGITTTQSTASNKCDLSGWPTVSYGYSGNQLTSVTSAAGKVVNYSYDAGGNLLSTVSVPGVGQIVRNGYDPATKKVVDQYDDANRHWAYDYQGSTTTLSDPLGHVTTTVFTAGGKPSSVTTPPPELGQPARQRRYEYDANDRLTKEIDPEGGQREYAYLLPGADPSTDRGNVRQIIARAKNGVDTRVSEFGYTDTCSQPKICNEPTYVKAPLGGAERQYTFTYDPAHGGLVSVRSPADQSGTVVETRFKYEQRQALIRSSSGQPSSVFGNYKDSHTSESPFFYVELKPFYVQVESSSCDAGSAPGCVGTSHEHRVTADYDGAQSTSVLNNAFPHSSTVVAVENGAASPVNLITTMAFDRIGNMTQQDGPRPDSDVSTYSYDADRRLSSTTGADPDGAGSLAAPVTMYGYDGLGRMTRTAQQNGAKWMVSCRRYIGLALDREWGAAETTAANQCPAENDPVPVVDYKYDGVGRLSGTTQRLSAAQDGDRVSAVDYYDDGQVKKERDGIGSPDEQDYRTFTYTLDGLPATVKDARGNLTTYEYDGFDELAKLRYPDQANGAASSTTDAESYHYDANGNLDTLTQRDGSVIRFGYDALDRLISKDVPEAHRDVSYTYDLLGRMTAATLPGANAPLSVAWSYDKLDRVLSTTSMGRTVSHSYAPDLTTATMTFPDGKSTTQNIDALGRTTEIIGIEERVGSDWRQPILADYTYDQLSRRTAVANGNSTGASYAYDAAGRLQGLTHDLAGTGQDVTFSLGYNQAGQITTRGFGDAYAWDNALNMNRGYQANPLDQYTQAGMASLGYDGRGNLARDARYTYAHDSENELTSVSGAANVQLAYDAIGRLARITSAGTATDLLYDGDALIGEYDTASGALQRRYVHGPGVDEPIVWYEGAGTSDKRWLHADERGSIVAGSNASGASVFTSSYGPFGEPGKVHTGTFGYTGQMRLPGVGLYYYKARYYSPTLGRFMETDPIGTAADQNRYSYVGNDAINLVDPMGLQASPATPLPGSFNEYFGRAFATFPGAGVPAVPMFFSWSIADTVHFALDAIGFIPVIGEPADLINSGIYAFQGDYVNAGLSAAAVIPVVGSLATGGKTLSKIEGLAFELRYLGRHIEGSKDVGRLLRKGEAAHVFESKEMAGEVAQAIIERGQFTGTRGGFDRYGLHFDRPIGTRIGVNGSRTPLTYGQIKVRPDGMYHVIPRTGPGKK